MLVASGSSFFSTIGNRFGKQRTVTVHHTGKQSLNKRYRVSNRCVHAQIHYRKAETDTAIVNAFKYSVPEGIAQDVSQRRRVFGPAMTHASAGSET